MTVFLLFEKKIRKAINELSRQLESIDIIKHYIITLFFDDYEFELEITRKKTPGDSGTNYGCKTMQAKLRIKTTKNLIEMVNYKKNLIIRFLYKKKDIPLLYSINI